MSGAYCDRCGYNLLNGDCECGGVVTLCKYPRPIPVGERLPELDEYATDGVCTPTVLAFELDTCTWGEAYYDFGANEWNFYDDWHNSSHGVTHWLPLPPSPILTSETESD